MIDYTDVDAKLEEYSEAFDIYMESGEMPPTMPEEDCLAGYMKKVIDNNPQIDGTDTTWVEVLKDGLISYFAALLEQFRAMQLEAMKELALIAKFQDAGIEDKRSLWQTVCGTIQKDTQNMKSICKDISINFRQQTNNLSLMPLQETGKRHVKRN